MPGNDELIYTATTADLKKKEEVRFYHAAIVESSDDAIISKDLEGIISTWNSAAHRMFGYTEEEVIGRSITIIIPPDLRDEEKDILRRVRTGRRVDHYETRRVSKDGRTIDVSITVSPVKDEEGRIIGASKIARDITSKKRAEATLRESEERFRLVANAAPVMIWMSAVEKLRTYFNQGWLEFTGRTIEAELGNGWTERVCPEDLAGCLETCTKAFDRREPFRMEYRLMRNDGEYRWIYDSGVPRFNADGSFGGYIGSAIDVTERKLAEEGLSKMGQRLLEAQEEERSWIARELHDDISQRLSLLVLNLQRLSVRSELADVREGIAQVIQQALNLGEDMRGFSHRLHASNLEYLGLAAAASGYCDELSRQHKVEINLRSENIPSNLSREVSLCLFRVLQEALQNAIKYSGSEHFQVSLIEAANETELTVQDSGIGFEYEKAFKGRGLGLTSMRERLKLVNGTISIDSQLGRGTTILARVPLNPRSSSAGADNL